MALDVVDYEIKGAEMQFVEVELDPGEAAIGEAGSMMFMDAGIDLDTVFGDASAHCQAATPGGSNACRAAGYGAAAPRLNARRPLHAGRAMRGLPKGRWPDYSSRPSSGRRGDSGVVRGLTRC